MITQNDNTILFSVLHISVLYDLGTQLGKRVANTLFPKSYQAQIMLVFSNL